MSGPWLKFYAEAWRADPRLKMCSLSARGLWIDLIAYMHEGEPYGHLTIDGVQPDLDGIAALVSRPMKEVRTALSELEQRNVFSRKENGTIYSRRMVRDKAKADQDRNNGKGGGNPNLLQGENRGVNPQENGGDKAKKLEARTEKLERKKERAPRATRLPSDAQPSEKNLSEAREIGLSDRECTLEWAKMRDWSAQAPKGAKLDWDAAWRNWCRGVVENPSRKSDAAASIALVLSQGETALGQYYAMQDSPEFEAWNAHRMRTAGKTYPADKRGGWTFPSRWPPGHQQEAA